MIKRVAIIGGGIGGLTLKKALKRVNIEAIICDPSKLNDNKVFKGAGIGIWENSLKVMEALDVNLSPDGRLITSAGYKSKDGKWLARPSASLDTAVRCLCMDRKDLIKHLEPSSEDEDVRFGDGWKMNNYVQKGSKMEISFENGEKELVDMVVGADGIHSTVRTIMMGEDAIKPKYCGYSFYRAIISEPENELVRQIELEGDRPSWEVWGPKQRFALVPLKDPELFWFGSFKQEIPLHRTFDDEAKKAQKEHASKIFSNYHQPVPAIIEATNHEDFVFTDIYEIEENLIDKWYDEEKKVVLLGDAVHSVAPNLAQGASLAIEDAIELASQLYMLNIGKRSSLEDAMRSYQENRQWRSKRVRWISNLIATIGQHDNPTFAKCRNQLMRMVPSFISSPIFDWVLRYSLGDPYKVPPPFEEF